MAIVVSAPISPRGTVDKLPDAIHPYGKRVQTRLPRKEPPRWPVSGFCGCEAWLVVLSCVHLYTLRGYGMICGAFAEQERKTKQHEEVH